MKTDPGKYDDILQRSHPVSQKHPPMDRLVRAAQFSPFAALTGYDVAVREAGRLTERFVELEEYERSILDEKMWQLKQQLLEHNKGNQSEYPRVTITYFQPDACKDGGDYVQFCGSLRRIDEQRRMLIMTSGKELDWKYIFAIETD